MQVGKIHSRLLLTLRAYKSSIEGEKIYFSGKVELVYDDTNVALVFDNICGTTLDNIPYEIAIKLSKGQHLEGYGTIKYVAYFIDHVTLEITVNPELLIVR
jgi:hypothetical protein